MCERDRQTDRQTDRQADRQTLAEMINLQMDKETDIIISILTYAGQAETEKAVIM